MTYIPLQHCNKDGLRRYTLVVSSVSFVFYCLVSLVLTMSMDRMYVVLSRLKYTYRPYGKSKCHLKFMHKMAAFIAVTSHMTGSPNSSGKAHHNVNFDGQAFMDSARLADVTFPNNGSMMRTNNPGESSIVGEVLKTASPKTLPYSPNGMIIGSSSRLHTRSVSLDYDVPPAVHIRNQRAQPRHRLEPRKKEKGKACTPPTAMCISCRPFAVGALFIAKSTSNNRKRQT